MDKYSFDNLDIFRYIFGPINANMYVIIDADKALVVDPHVCAEMLALLQQRGVQKVDILLTHEHNDHTSGVNWLKDNFETTLVCQKNCAEYIADESNNRGLLCYWVLAEQDNVNGTNYAEKFRQEFVPYVCQADVTFENEFSYQWQKHHLSFVATPGHSLGSCCIFLDNRFIFTGDSLLPDLPTITRFPGGSTKVFNQRTLPFLKSLDKALIVLPGHGGYCPLADFDL